MAGEAPRQIIRLQRQELDQGLSFDKAAKTRSDHPLAYRCGDSFWTPTATVEKCEPNLRQVLNDLPVNKLSSVIALEKSFAIVRMSGRKDEAVIPFEKAAAEIAESMIAQQRDEQRQKLFARFTK